MPSAAWPAVNEVVRPSSLDSSVRASKSLPVAPLMARTLFIDCSNEPAVASAATPMPTIGRVRPVVRPLPALLTEAPTFWIFLPMASNFLLKVWVCFCIFAISRCAFARSLPSNSDRSEMRTAGLAMSDRS